MSGRPTVWVFGDQLNRRVGPLARFSPGECRVLLVVSNGLVTSKRWHRQRLHLVLSALAHFAAELRDEGFDVDERSASTLEDGLAAHRLEFEPVRVIAMEPMTWEGRRLLERCRVEIEPNDQFLCHHADFAEWADERNNLKLEDFYRWQRRRLNVLIESDGSPVGGQWNLDHQNRQPPPRDGRTWPTITSFELDEIDRDVIADLPDGVWGAEPTGIWPVTRAQAVQRLEEFVATGLDPFGSHEDAMLAAEWKLAHSALSSSLNLGLIHPSEMIDRAVEAFDQGRAPLNSVEGFVRQVLGWREYVWGVYWRWMPEYRSANELDATAPLPPVLTGEAATEMACVAGVMTHLHDRGYAHHIERLMVLGNLALTSGVDPWAMTQWMWASFVDGAEWVMLPNVIGMALHADGGRMATKPYASGGAYINRMSDYCRDCAFDPKQRVGDQACPFTTLYWDFIARHADRFAGNHRMARQVAASRRLANIDDVREHAVVLRRRLAAGEL